MIAKQIDIFEISKPKYKITKPIRLVENFAGIGSQAKAFKNLNANFEHYRIVEFDKYAIASYNAIHGTNFEPLDITKITAKDLNIVDTGEYEYILTYSFPCQDLSIAGKGAGMSKGENTRSGLLWEVERILKECKELPQILLMENVPQVVGSKNFKDFRKWQLFLEKLGYSNYFELLNAKNYGIPQNRNRCYMISILGDYYYQFPKKQKLKYRLKDFLEDEVDEKYYLSDKMIEGMKNTNFESYKLENKLLDKNGIASTIISRFEGTPQRIKDTNTTICINSKVNGKQPSLQDRVYDSEGISTSITTSFLPSIAIPEKTKKGYALAQVGDGIVVVKGNYSPSNHNASRIVDKNGIAPTVMENHGTVTATQLADLRIRKLTPKECWRLMGFPDEAFEKAQKVNSNAQLYKQAGNSIVVPVLEAIFKELI